MTVIYYILLGWIVLSIVTALLAGWWLSTTLSEPAPAQSSSELTAAVDDRQVTRVGDRHPMVR